MNIKLFENFGESPEFRQMIGSTDADIDLYSEPYPLRSGRVAGGNVSWKCDFEYRKWGIELGTFQFTRLDFEMELEDEEGEEIIKEITVPKETLQDQSRMTVKVQGFPLSISHIEINMRHSEDPQDWKYTVILGKEPE